MMQSITKTLRGGGALLVAAVLALSLIPVTKAWATTYRLSADFGYGVPVQTGDKFTSGDSDLGAVIYKDPSDSEIARDTPTGTGYPYEIKSQTKDGVTYTNYAASIRLTGGKWEVTLKGSEPKYRASLVTTGLKGATASLSKTSNIGHSERIIVRVIPEAGKSFDIKPTMTLQNATEAFPLTWDDQVGGFEGVISGATADVVVTITGEAKAPTYAVGLDTTGLTGASANAPNEIAADQTIEVVITPDRNKMFSSAPLVEATNATVESTTPNADGTYTARVKDPVGIVNVTVTGATVDAVFTASINASGLKGAIAELSKTAEIGSDDTVTVTIGPAEGKRFDAAPTMTVTGATVKAQLQKRPVDGAYVGTISSFTANAVVTVTGEAVDGWSATIDKSGLKGGTATITPKDGFGPDTTAVLDVTFDDDKKVVTTPTVTATNAEAKLVLQKGNTYTYEVTKFTGNATFKVTGEAKKADPVKPDIKVSGDGKHVIGAGGTIEFTCSLPLDELTGVSVDGKALAAKDYEAKSGSTIITLKAAYLDTLAVGKHEITLSYTGDRAASASFEVVKTGAKPVPTPDNGDGKKLAKTGDPLDAAPLAGVLGLSAVALAGAFALRKRVSE